MTNTNKTGGADAMSADEVLAVLDRMRDQASLGRCCDVKITAQRSIQCIDEDRNAIAAVAELIEREAALIAERGAQAKRVAELESVTAGLVTACILARNDIDYILRAYPDICGRATRGEAKLALDLALMAASLRAEARNG